MTGGQIYGNHKANGELANVYVSENSYSSFTMTGGIIDGGFVAAQNGYVTVTLNKNDGSNSAEMQYIKKILCGSTIKLMTR